MANSEIILVGEALRADELQFSNAFEHAVIGMALVSLKGEWLKVNRSFCQLLGYSSAELLLKRFQDITHPGDLSADLENLRLLMEGRIQGFQREKRYLNNRGQTLWVQVSVSLLRDGQGEPVHCVAQVQDITARKISESALRESEGTFRTLSEAIPQMVWMTLADGSNIYFNQRWCDYTGMTREESSGHNWVKPFHPEEQAAAQAAWKHATETEGEYSVECRLRKHDGSYRWWLVRGMPFRDGSGQIVKWVGSCTDIDDIKHALESARTSEEKIAEQSALINQAQDAILLMSLDGRIRFWNQGAERLYGWTSAEALGKKGDELLSQDSQGYAQRVQTLFNEGLWAGELKVKSKFGAELIVESRLTLARDSEGQAKSILALSTDISERKKIQAQFLRSQRMESIGTLAGGIAHDLNNILTPIMVSAEFLRYGEKDVGRLSTLDLILNCSQRGADMMRKVLSFARGIEGKRDELQIKELLRDVEKISGDTFLKSIQITLEMGTELQSVSGDTTQLHQVFLNLCINARDAMPGGGTLALSARNVTLDAEASLLNGGSPPGVYVMVSVEDSGTGIPKAILDKIFEPFFTTKELGKGTGLGLSTTLGIIQSHGGFIRVYSEIGRGTQFNVYLPVSEKKSAARKPGSSRLLPRGSGEWLLVIDDEGPVRQIMCQVLKAFGYQVLVASGGQEAIALYAIHQNEVVAVITDMMMPFMDGIRTMQELRKINPDVTVIAASGLNANAGSMATEYFLSKPFTTETLLRTVRDALAAGKVVPKTGGRGGRRSVSCGSRGPGAP